MAKKARAGSGKRFKSLSRKLKKKGVRNPNALAASIGRKKFGKKKFQKMASTGRRRAARRRRRR
jgi:hypothetical protein